MPDSSSSSFKAFAATGPGLESIAAGELKSLGVTDYFVVADEGQFHWALSLGVFRSRDAAQRRHIAEAERLRAVFHLPLRVLVRRGQGPLAFAAPPMVRTGPVDEPFVERIAFVLNIDRAAIVAAQWVDNGPGWVAVMLASADEVLALEPGFVDFDLGVVGPYPPGSAEAFELRGFFPKNGTTVEDPVTGSLNASVAQWLVGTGQATTPYLASQGTALGRLGRIYVDADTDGQIWVGGGTVTCIRGQVDL